MNSTAVTTRVAGLAEGLFFRIVGVVQTITP